MRFYFLLVLFFICLVLLALYTSFSIIAQQTVAIIERLGKFKRAAKAGPTFLLPFGIEKIVCRIPLRIQQINIKIETKTKDNVFVHLNLAVQFRVDPVKVVDAYYKLALPIEQIKAYVEDAIRSSLPKYTLDESYEKKDDIALDVFDTVSSEMSEYGYIIIKTLITSIDPAAEVKNSMNAINAAQRQRQAAQELANADKIKVVTAAQADAEKDRLRGEGIANQRKAIVDGLSESFKELQSSGLSERDVMSILLTEQYLDALHSFAKGKNRIVFLPSSATAAEDIRTQILSSFIDGKKRN